MSIEFSALLPSSVVECEDDLPASCEAYLLDLGIADLTAGNGCDDSEYDVFCTMLSSNSELDPDDQAHFTESVMVSLQNVTVNLVMMNTVSLMALFVFMD